MYLRTLPYAYNKSGTKVQLFSDIRKFNCKILEKDKKILRICNFICTFAPDFNFLDSY